MFCPVCNGLQPLQAECSQCKQEAADLGRLTDFTGPYAPYEPLEAGNELYNQSTGAVNCKHIAFCFTCEQTIEIAVAEWNSSIRGTTIRP